jgi:hypothetical protein
MEDELMDVVDRHDNIVGHKKRSELYAAGATRCHWQLRISLLSVVHPGRWAMNNEFIQGHEWEA